MTIYGLLDHFDAVFASTFTCLLPPPYDTAWEIEQSIDAACEKAARNVYILRRLNKRRYAKRLNR